MGWLKDFFCGKPCGTGGEEPAVKAKLGTVEYLYQQLMARLSQYPNHVACLNTNYTYPQSTSEFEYKFWVRMVDSKLHYFKADHGLAATEGEELTLKNILKVITNDAGSSFLKDPVQLNIGWTLNWIDLDEVPKRSQDLITNALASAQPFTTLPVFDSQHAVANYPEKGYAVFQSQYDPDYIVPYWVSDLLLHLEKISLPDNPNAYRITDELRVDIKLLPDTHWRKWVRVEPAVDNANAAMKYVPRDIARGNVQYFDVIFDFNEARLTGVAFAPGSLLKRAIDNQITQLDKAIPWDNYNWDEYGVYHVSEKSDTYLKPERIQVRWDSRTYLLEDYLELERQSTTNLERPYLAPNQKEVSIDGNKFSIDADYYIDFTPWEPKK